MSWGAVVSAGASLLGGYLANQSQKGIASDNLDAQREFAQNGVRWRVADAKAAGIHPLYAMGFQGPAFSPVAVGDSFGPALASAGQDIGRAIDTTRTKSERQEARLAALAVDRGELENELLRSQIAKLRQTGPALPSAVPDHSGLAGQGDVPSAVGLGSRSSIQPFEIEAVKIPSTWPDRPSEGAGAFPDRAWVRLPNGHWAAKPQKDTYGEDADISQPAIIDWYFRNSILPRIFKDSQHPPPRELLPSPYHEWRYNRWSNEWYPSSGVTIPLKERR